MLLVRLSGHSGAGKSRLLAALPKYGLKFRKTVLYTSRPPRPGEVDGREYHFRPEGVIRALPADRYFVGPVREMWQAVDLDQMERDLRSGETVIIEIFWSLWPGVVDAIKNRIPGPGLHTASVFLTAIDPVVVESMAEGERAAGIQDRVQKTLEWRGKDSADSVRSRSESAVSEILAALADRGMYDEIMVTAPEGPDGEDDWTRGEAPVGMARDALERFLHFVRRREQSC